MDDLISRQAVLDYIDSMPSELTKDGRRMIRRIRLTEYIQDSLPSAQPEIVRCGECKHGDWYSTADGNRYCYCMEHGSSGHQENDYCSYGEVENAFNTEVHNA